MTIPFPWPSSLLRLFIVCLMPLVASASADSGAEKAFAEANALFAAGDYEGASRAYAALSSSGQHSANLFYNSGLAAAHLGKRGHAALQYERALVLEPGHAEARANLAVIRDETGARVPKPGMLAPIRRMGTIASWSYGGGFALWLIIGSAVGAFIAPVAWRTALVFVASASMCFVLLAAVVLWDRHQEQHAAIVVVREAVGRSEPAERSNILEVLPAGSRVQILRDHGAWTYCRLPRGMTGWVLADHIEGIQPEEK